MPYIPHTPESLLPRSDSKNPSTTCRGITSSGRPCRRSLAASPGASLSRSSPRPPSLVAVVSEDNGEAAGFFCWQHKDQVEEVAFVGRNALHRDDDLKEAAYQRRTSIDTLVDRIGILDIGTATEAAKANAREKPIRRNGRRGKKAPGLLSLFCCIEYDSSDSNNEPKIRPYQPQNNGHQPKEQWRSKDTSTAPPLQRPPFHSDARDTSRTGPMRPVYPTPLSTNSLKPSASEERKRLSTNKMPGAGASVAHKAAQQLGRPSLPRDPSTQTAYLLSLIPKHLSPQTTSLLLTELAKPISENDDEGYIYIFWLTDSDTTAAPSPKAVSALLSPSLTSYNHKHGRPSEILEAASTNNNKKTILLKIGRASNVHRRLNEWTRQCGYNLSLIRYYPHVPSSQVPSPSASPSQSPPTISPRKVPNVHRVERLIHIELADKRVKQDLCGKCGKDHREWFAIDASRGGLKTVDEVIRRWVGWGETRGGG
ncbi:MAG: hypothetical protein M1840_004881 [Geoglossum simile]|nr:MAG: hypothetical protein M1840_004881 [Geoglossum simile]